MRKIIFYVFLLTCGFAFSQDDDNDNDYVKGFSIKAGVNGVDSSGEQTPFSALEQFDTHIAFSNPFAVGVDYRFSRLLSVGLLGSINKWKEGDFFDGGFLGDPLYYGTLTEVDYFAIDLDLKLYFSELLFDADWLDLYVSGGGSFFDEQQNTIAPTAGFGGNLWLTDKFGLNLQAVGKFAGENFTKSNNIQYLAAVTYRFMDNDADNDGIKDKDDECPNTPGLPEFNGCPDRDGDGIQDSLDDCPDTPGLAEFNGCADSDGDGIMDKNDDCPDTPGLAELNGCPDRDGDGIADNLDECPDQAGVASQNGCPEPEKEEPKEEEITTEPVEIGEVLTDGDGVGPIRFDFDQSFIKDKYKDNLDKIIELIKGSSATYSIEGHTDSLGSYNYNNGLSEKRAKAVRDYFVAKGLPKEMFVISAQGEYKPEVDNDSDSNRALNRRCIIIRIE